ncbi:hypothetical protein Bbelb_204750 [Branchiostoma belcheri]|nr:hypothetical protein Bbelb_204750 [Branchiostoma belcheri]
MPVKVIDLVADDSHSRPTLQAKPPKIWLEIASTTCVCYHSLLRPRETRDMRVRTKASATPLHIICSRNLRYCPRQVRETAYFSLVRSTIEYGAVIWDPYLRKDIDTLEMVNRRAARFVTSNHRRQDVSVTALLHDLRWPSLQSRRQQARLVMMYKITNGLVAIPSSRLIPAVARTRANHAHKYKTLRPHCSVLAKTVKGNLQPPAAFSRGLQKHDTTQTGPSAV